jgi:hypothetical protein
MNRLALQITITVCATCLALIHIRWPGIAIDSITITLAVAAIIPWLSPLFRAFKAAGIEIEFQELQSDVKTMQVALTGIVTTHERDHLRQLTEPGPYLVQLSDPLWRELESLDAKGFVRPTAAANGRLDTIRARVGNETLDPNRPSFNLKDYVQVTEAGEEYLRLLSSTLKCS